MSGPRYTLGLSCFYHDSAACLMKDNDVLFAAHEERYTRKKQDESIPVHAIEHALTFAGITMADISVVCFYEKPLLKFFDRIVPTMMDVWPRGFRTYHMAMQEWMTKKLWIGSQLSKELDYKGPIEYCQHHESHAASAFFVSGFEDAAVLTVDGVGEWATTTIAKGSGTSLTLLEEVHFPHSLGLLYSALTYYLGFRVNSAEYKVMGLAPYGEPKYMDQMRKLIELRPDGSFRLNMEYFTYEYGLTMTGNAMEALFGQPRRTPEATLTQFHKDVARSLQQITDEAMLNLARRAKELTGCDRLCLAGGVALNCVANGKILRSGMFRDVFIQPAAGDAGGALGAALMSWHVGHGGSRTPRMQHAFLGNSYTDTEIAAALDAAGLPSKTFGDDELFDHVAGLLEGENVVGWFQGRMEYGPRSLGNRSILADARNKANWQKVNLKIKFRESFRPFAPTVLAERAGEWFDIDRESPYMLLVADTRPDKRAAVPAITHVDGSARLQTVSREQNPRYHALISAFERRTGCPVIINTSFNVRGEPIVESPANAIQTFLHTHMDYLVLGNRVVSKRELPPAIQADTEAYLKQFALD